MHLNTAEKSALILYLRVSEQGIGSKTPVLNLRERCFVVCWRPYWGDYPPLRVSAALRGHIGRDVAVGGLA